MKTLKVNEAEILIFKALICIAALVLYAWATGKLFDSAENCLLINKKLCTMHIILFALHLILLPTLIMLDIIIEKNKTTTR